MADVTYQPRQTCRIYGTPIIDVGPLNMVEDSGLRLGWLIERSHRLGSAALRSGLAAEGLNPTQWLALQLISTGHGETATDLSRMLGHDKGATTRVIEGLAKHGWITRKRTACDRRRVDLALTSEGEAMVSTSASHVVARWNGRLTEWSIEEVENLTFLLRKLRDTMSISHET